MLKKGERSFCVIMPASVAEMWFLLFFIDFISFILIFFFSFRLTSLIPYKLFYKLVFPKTNSHPQLYLKFI